METAYVYYFSNMHVVNLNLNHSVCLITDECVLFWKNTRIPTHYNCDIVFEIQ